MQRRASLRRNRPHILPPLPDLHRFTLQTMDPLKPPDLFLTKNRLNSPAPRPNVPRNSDDIYSANNERPTIKIFEPTSEKIEKHNKNLDLLSDTISKERNSLLNQFQKTNSLNVCELDSKSFDIAHAKNYSRKNFDYLGHNLTKTLKSQKIMPLEKPENLSGTFESKIFQIPNRYTPLMPIAQDKVEN